MSKELTPREKYAEVNKLKGEGMTTAAACEKVGWAVKNYHNMNLQIRYAKTKKTKKNVVTVYSDDEKSEDVKIVVMKWPGHVIEKIAAALGGVL